MTKEALNIALKALERVNTSPHLEDWHHAFDEEIIAIKQVLANDALEKMAENARELGLDYEPQRTWVGLTKKEFQEAVEGLEDLEDCWVAIESALRSKND
jgi:pyruvate/2-oxoglutarate dehydrogenase complex dihydrolipoamide dehydrogenase (E3) component